MKKNLLTAIVVFFFTFIVLLIMNQVPDKENKQIEDQYYVVEN